MCRPRHASRSWPEPIREISHIATLPEITLKIVELVEDPKSTAQDLHKVISNDPALCTRILKVVNSLVLRPAGADRLDQPGHRAAGPQRGEEHRHRREPGQALPRRAT